jgi:hypothetical protein
LRLFLHFSSSLLNKIKKKLFSSLNENQSVHGNTRERTPSSLEKSSSEVFPPSKKKEKQNNN